MTTSTPISEQPLIDDTGTACPWSQALKYLDSGSTYWLATNQRDSPLHVVPLLAVVVGSTLYFAANAGTRKARNLARDHRCTVTLSSPGFDVVIQGTATKVIDQSSLERVAGAYMSKYGWHVTARDGALQDTEGAPTAGPPPYDAYAITPTTIFAFGTNDDTMNLSTRWEFSR